MIKKAWGILILMNSIVLVLYGPCFAQSISSDELINNAKQYNGKTVSYSGEVIGDIMVRKEHAWVNVNDGKNAIGIWIQKELTNNIQYTGRYNVKGDILEIKGIFHRSCLEHGGDLDIHAQSITKISPGSKIPRAINTGAINLAFGLSCILLLVFLLRMRQSRKSTSLHLF